MISTNLIKNDLRYILVENKGKTPIEKDWQNSNNYKIDDIKLINHIKNGGNYGVATGFKNLIVVDFDNEEYQNKLFNLLPSTFTVKTGGGLCHLYYFIDNPVSFKILDEQKNTILDFQGKGKQVIGVGSTHPNGNKYEVVRDLDISLITLGEIKALFNQVFPDKWLPEKIFGKKEIIKTESNNLVEEIKRQYSIKKYLEDIGININKNPTQCPFHNSKGGKCFSFNEEVWHCFHCEEKGDLFHLYQKINNIDFKESLKQLCEKIGIEYKPLVKQQNKTTIQKGDFFEELSKEYLKEFPCYYDENKILYSFNKDENVWNISDERDLVNVAKNILNQSGLNDPKNRSKFLNAVLDRARWQKPEELSKDWLHFEDCFFNIYTREKIEPNKNYFSKIKIPHKLGKITKTPIIDKKIISWVGIKQYRLFLQICAYSLYKGYPFARFFIFYGSGRDGKSTAGDFITKICGDSNSCSVDIDMLQTNRFESQKMYQKTLAICGEVDYKLLQNTRKLKGVTGGDPISIEFKNKNPFNYYNFAKLIWYANGLPPTYDKTEGFYRRTVILKFPNKFKEKINPLEDIPKEEYENFCYKLTFVLEDLLKNCFYEKELEQKKEEYEELSNPVLMFFKKYIKPTTTETILSITEIYEKYSKFARENSYRVFDYKSFKDIFSNIDEIEIEKKKLYICEESGKCYTSSTDIIGEYTRSNRYFIRYYEFCP